MTEPKPVRDWTDHEISVAAFKAEARAARELEVEVERLTAERDAAMAAAGQERKALADLLRALRLDQFKDGVMVIDVTTRTAMQWSASREDLAEMLNDAAAGAALREAADEFAATGRVMERCTRGLVAAWLRDRAHLIESGERS